MVYDLNVAEKKYPIHKKELLVIFCGLKKWHLDLLGSTVHVYTDHKTLINFNSQKDLLQWQEYMLQYELHVKYIPGEHNTVADMLSWLPSEVPSMDLPPYAIWSSGVNATMSIPIDAAVLDNIKHGYTQDPFCEHLIKTNTLGAILVNGLWYIRTDYSFPKLMTFGKIFSAWPMTHWGILVLTKFMLHYEMPTIGPTCDGIQKNLIYHPVNHVNEINLPQ